MRERACECVCVCTHAHTHYAQARTHVHTRNAGVVVASAALWYFDEKRGQEALSDLKGKSSSRFRVQGLGLGFRF